MLNKNPSRKAQIMGQTLFAMRVQLRALLNRARAGETLDDEEIFLANSLRSAIIQGKVELTEMGFDPERAIASATMFTRKVEDTKPQQKLKRSKKNSEFSRSPERGIGMYGVGPTLKFWR